MPALLGMFIAIALLWPIIKAVFFIWVALMAFMGFLIVLQGVLKVLIWLEERRLARKAEADAHMIGMAAVMEALWREKRGQRSEVVTLLDRGDGVYVPSRGEW